MRYLKWGFWTVVIALVAAVLHYALPQRDIVRVVNTYQERQDFGSNRWFWSSAGSGGAQLDTRDVQFIQTIKANGKPMVYRNEDTGWGWPPYFKFDTANLQTHAADAVSSKDAPQWYAMKHYGWRNEFFSIFPNAISLKPVAGPDVTLIPWFNIVVVVLLLAVFRTVQVRLRRLWRRLTGPASP